MKKKEQGMFPGLIVLLCLVSMLLASGCKKNVGTPEDNAIVEEEEQTEENAEAEEAGYVFGFSGIDMSNPFFSTLELSIATELETLDPKARIVTKDPAGSSQTQLEQLQEFIDAKVDAVFITPVNWEEVEPGLLALKDAGIAVINVDSRAKNMDLVDAYIGSDNKNAGYVCGQDLKEKLPDGGKLIILECSTMNSVIERMTGFEEAIAESGFEIVARVDTGGDLEQSRTAMASILDEYDDIDAVMCGNDQSALGALVSIDVADRDNIIVYGVDGSPDLKKELVKPKTCVAATGAQSPVNMGKDAASVGLAILNDEDYEEYTYEETFLINKDNIELYGTDGWQ